MNYRITADGSTAVSMTEEWQPMQLCPREAKVLLLTTGRTAVLGSGISPDKRKDYLGWAPMPKEPQWLKDGQAN